MVDSIPPELYRNDRPINNDFPNDEEIYIRFEEIEEDEDGIVHPHHSSFRCPDQSCNRSLYSEPAWVLLPNWPNFGYGSFLVEDIPFQVPEEKDAAGPRQHWFKIEHDPKDENYAHCEIRAYKDNEFKKRAKRVNNDKVKLRFMIELSKIITVIKEPDEN